MNTKTVISVVVLTFALIFLVGCTQTNTDNNAVDELNGGSNMADNNDVNSGNQLNNLDNFEKVKVGDNISVHYVGKLEDGSTFDSSVGRQPLTFDVGAGQMIKGFDSGVVGMKVNETKTIIIQPAEAYGEYNPDYVREFPKSSFESFPGGLEGITVGMVVSAENGEQGTIIEVNEDTVKVDFNHSLAGKKLIFEVTIVSINN
jgi:FKBP-type peptidyl-prolyl cis-trans isomerase 2